MLFEGQKCFVCTKRFVKGDDVVVCPDCGTPYHRDCYFIESKCTNTEIHESGGSWQKESIIKITIPNEIRCPHCGALCRSSVGFCQNCGEKLINFRNNKL